MWRIYLLGGASATLVASAFALPDRFYPSLLFGFFGLVLAVRESRRAQS